MKMWAMPKIGFAGGVQQVVVLSWFEIFFSQFHHQEPCLKAHSKCWRLQTLKYTKLHRRQAPEAPPEAPQIHYACIEWWRTSSYRQNVFFFQINYCKTMLFFDIIKIKDVQPLTSGFCLRQKLGYLKIFDQTELTILNILPIIVSKISIWSTLNSPGWGEWRCSPVSWFREHCFDV